MTFDYRLKKEKDFKTVFNKGKRLFSSSLTLIYLPSSELKAGFAVSKKHGGSVNRNRIKRLLREAFREVQGEIKGKYSIILVPKVAEEYSFKRYKDHLQCMIKKEKL